MARGRYPACARADGAEHHGPVSPPTGVPSPATPGIPPVALMLGAVVSVQFGGALAATLIPTVGPIGSVALRMGFAAVLLLLIVRPRLRGRSRSDWAVVASFGVALTAMNLTFYGSLERLPLGVAVTVEFLGPLTLAAVLSRRPRDLLAVAAALAGVVLVSGALTSASLGDLDLLGLALAASAGACWAGYILLGRGTGQRFEGLDGIALAIALGALITLPLGAATAGTALLDPGALLRGVGIAVLSAAIPYSLELLALRRLTPQVFGILTSLQPAAAAIAGLIVLGQVLEPGQLVGLALVVSAGVLVLARRGSRGRDGHGGPDLDPPAQVV